MKKLLLFSLPILLLVGLFVFNPLDSYAYNTGSYDFYFSYDNGGRDYSSHHVYCMPRDTLVVYLNSGALYIEPVGRLGLGDHSSYGMFDIITDSGFEGLIGNEHTADNVISVGVLSAMRHFTSNVPIFKSRAYATQYVIDGIYNPDAFVTPTGDQEIPIPTPPVGGVSGDDSIPAPHVHWGQKNVTYNNKKYTVYNKSLYFDNYVYDTVNHDKWYLELHYAWSTVRGGSMGKGDSNSFRYYYDDTDIVFQTTQNSSYIKPVADSTLQSQLVECPGVIHFNTGEFLTSYNSFLSINPISSSQFEYSLGKTPLASLFWNSDNLADINFAFNVPIVVCRYYRQNENGSINYGPWTSTALEMPKTGCYCYLITDEQGQRLGIFNSSAYTKSDDEPDPGGTTPGLDPKPGGDPDPSDKPIPDPDPSAEVNLSDLVDSLDGIFDFLKSVPNFFRVLFGFLPSWLTDLLAICIALAIIIGLVKLVF